MNAFESEVARSARVQGLYYQRLTLAHAGTVKLGTNPYDSFLVHQGKHVPLELKSLKVHGPFPFDRVAEHQVLGLNKAIEYGCHPWLLINMRSLEVRTPKPVGSDCQWFPSKKHRPALVAWAFPFSRWDELREAYGDRKSVPLTAFGTTDFFIPLPRLSVQVGEKKERIWDLTHLLQSTS